jgi:hypothetical protein
MECAPCAIARPAGRAVCPQCSTLLSEARKHELAAGARHRAIAHKAEPDSSASVAAADSARGVPLLAEQWYQKTGYTVSMSDSSKYVATKPRNVKERPRNTDEIAADPAPLVSALDEIGTSDILATDRL